MGQFKMPALGADMEKGILTSWNVALGDTVKRGDIIAEVETDKGNIEVEVWEAGKVAAIYRDEGETVPVNTVLAYISTDGEPAPPLELVPEEASETEAKEISKESSKPELSQPRVEVPPSSHTPDVDGRRPKISPLARKVAKALGVNLALIKKGSGPGGSITKTDVEALKAEPTQVQSDETFIAFDQLSPMRQAISKAMSRSKQEIPHYYLDTEIDMQICLDWIQEQNKSLPIQKRLLPACVIVKAVALALHEVPELNGYWLDDGFHQHHDINIGIAVSLRNGGLMAPALNRVNEHSLEELMPKFMDLVNRARKGKLRSSELENATFTVTNLGDLGVETVYGVIYPPQVGIAGFGKIVSKPWVEYNEIKIKPILKASLSADHRASDGHRGGIFLNSLTKYLNSPELLK